MPRFDDTELRRMLARLIGLIKQHRSVSHAEIERFMAEHASESYELEGLAALVMALTETEELCDGAEP